MIFVSKINLTSLIFYLNAFLLSLAYKNGNIGVVLVDLGNICRYNRIFLCFLKLNNSADFPVRFGTFKFEGKGYIFNGTSKEPV